MQLLRGSWCLCEDTGREFINGELDDGGWRRERVLSASGGRIRGWRSVILEMNILAEAGYMRFEFGR